MQTLHETGDGVVWAGTRRGAAWLQGERFVKVDFGRPAEFLGASSADGVPGKQLYFALTQGLVVGEPTGGGHRFRWLYGGPASYGSAARRVFTKSIRGDQGRSRIMTRRPTGSACV